MNRRQLLQTLSALAAVSSSVQAAAPKTRMPVIFIGHGSPMNAISDNGFTRALSAWGQSLPRPAAILSVSAHWLTPGETLVDVQARPRTIHDFGGFPRALHEMQYPAPGSPDRARALQSIVKSRRVKDSDDWGLDHGTWTVLHHLYPQADIPTFQLSIDYSAPGRFHHAIGRELAALRERGVLIVGSGNIVHNLRYWRLGQTEPLDWAQRFDEDIAERIAEGHHEGMMGYETLGPDALLAIPTPEHYLPLLYALGLQRDEDSVEFINADVVGPISMRSVLIGMPA